VNSFLSSYEALVGSENVDASVDPPVLAPASGEMLADLVRKAASEKRKIAVRGRGTYPAPEAPGGGIVIATDRLSSIEEIAPDDFTVTVRAGATVKEVSAELEKSGFAAPLDSLYGRGATLGGAFMAGGFGPSGYRYRGLRDAVIGVVCVAADGAEVTGGGRTAKNVTGYELPRFFAGTLGLFGIVSRLTVRVSPLPESRVVLVAGVEDGVAVLNAVNMLMAGTGNVSFVEVSLPDDGGGAVAVCFEGFRAMVRKSLERAADTLMSAGARDAREEDFGDFAAARSRKSAVENGPGLCTFTMPPRSVAGFVERVRSVPETPPVLAHPHAGKVHVSCRDERLVKRLGEISVALGGKYPVLRDRLEREGISRLFTGAELELLLRVKRTLDPDGILNPHLLR